MSGKRICKICGKEYDYCKTNRPTGLFRWQDVACSPGHGAMYFAQVMEARRVSELNTDIPVPAAEDVGNNDSYSLSDPEYEYEDEESDE